MTAQASLHAAAPAHRDPASPGRPALAHWAAVLTLLAALLGAGVCITATQPDTAVVQTH